VEIVIEHGCLPDFLIGEYSGTKAS